MYPEPQLPDMHQATPKRNPFRRRRAAEPTERSSGLFVQSLDRCLDVAAVVNHPLIGVLMTEDFCWHTAVLSWRERKPPRWHLAERSAWRAEQAALDEKRARIRELAAELGLTAPA
jgi:hypothetical protein